MMLNQQHILTENNLVDLYNNNINKTNKIL